MQEEQDYFIFFGFISLFTTFLQSYALIRHLKRLPQDTIGIVIYSVIIAVFIIITAENFIGWWKVKHNRELS